MKIKQRLISAVCAISVVVTAFCGALPVSAAQTVRLMPEKESPFGEFEGWGTSLCWWANRLGYSEELTEQAGDVFFSEDGLGLDIARYNLGGGDDPTHTHITRSDSKVPSYAIPQFESDGTTLKRDENGDVVYSYDWNNDSNQLNILKKAREYNENLMIEGFTNSPPWFMTESGCSSGGVGSKENLPTANYDIFSKFVADVTDHFEEIGLKFDSYSPMNEPSTQTTYWGANSPKQEGNHVAPGANQSALIKALKKEYVDRGIDTKVVGPEETSIDYSITSYNALDDDAKAALDRIDVHTYGGSKRSQMKETAVAAQKDLWMSEVDGNWDYLGLADRITVDMNEMQPKAWILWDIVDFHRDKNFAGEENNSMNFNGKMWGMAMGNHDTEKIELSRKYYGFGQYTKFIQPGYTIISNSSIGDTLAAYDKKTGKIVIVTKNTGDASKECNFDLSAFAHPGSTVRQIRTSGNEEWAELEDIAVIDKSFTATIKEKSITTFVVEPNRAATVTNWNTALGIDTIETVDGDYKLINSKDNTVLKADLTYGTYSSGDTWSIEQVDTSYMIKGSNGKYLVVKDGDTLGYESDTPFDKERGTVIMAFYEDGLLKSIEINELKKDDEVKYDKEISKGLTAKLLAWDSLEKINPLDTEIELKVYDKRWDIQVEVNDVSSLSIEADKSLIFVGDTVNLTSKMLPETIEDQSVTWSCDNTDIAEINQSGVLTAKAVGEVVVRATSNAYSKVYGAIRLNIIAQDGYFTLVNKNSGKALQPAGRTYIENGAFVQWSDLNYATQQWVLEPADDGYFYIVNRLLDCAVIADASANAVKQTNTYADNQLAQWSLVENGGYYNLANRKRSEGGTVWCLEVSGKSTADGGSVIGYTSNGGENQLWAVTPVTKEPDEEKNEVVDYAKMYEGTEYTFENNIADATNDFTTDIGKFVISGTAARGDDATLFIQKDAENKAKEGSASLAIDAAEADGKVIDITFDMYAPNSNGTSSFVLNDTSGSCIAKIEVTSWGGTYTASIGETQVETAGDANIYFKNNTESSGYSIANGAKVNIKLNTIDNSVIMTIKNNTATNEAKVYNGTFAIPLPSSMEFKGSYTQYSRPMIVDNFITNIITKENQELNAQYLARKLIIPADVYGNLNLPTSSGEGTVEWTSSDPSIATTGIVTRGSEDKEVILTASVTYKGETVTRTTPVTVKAAAIEKDTEAYLFVHFVGEGSENGEQIYFSVSEDGQSFTTLNESEPVLKSTLGTTGLRDPHIVRSPEGDKFYMIATDLSIFKNGDWSAAQTAGSKSIMVWESNDLVNWTKQRRVQVGTDDAGCVWAPESFYDESKGAYMVYWASKIQADSFAKHRIYRSYTRDFIDFTEPEIYVDKSNDVIDSTIVKSGDTYYRYSKDEKNKTVICETSTDLNSKAWSAQSGFNELANVEGPTCFKLNGDNDKWCLLVDYYGGDGYAPYTITNIATGAYTKTTLNTWQGTTFRHGSVIPITLDEYNALKTAYPTERLEETYSDTANELMKYDFEGAVENETVIDRSGNENNALLKGTATYVEDADKTSSVLYTDGATGSYLEFPLPKDENGKVLEHYTVSMDMKNLTTGNYFNFYIGDGSSESTGKNYYGYKMAADILLSAKNSSTEKKTTLTGKGVQGSWTHVDFVVSAGTCTIYVDGTNVGTMGGYYMKNVNASVGRLSFSAWSADNYAKCYYDDFIVYDKALSPTGIATIN